LKKILVLFVVLLWGHPMMAAEPLPLSPSGVKTLAPEGAIKPTGTWSLGTRAGDFVYIAGMRNSGRMGHTLRHGACSEDKNAGQNQ